MNNNDQRGKKKNSSPAFFLFFLILILASLADSLPRRTANAVFPALFTLLLLGLLVFLLRPITRKLKAQGQSSAAPFNAPRTGAPVSPARAVSPAAARTPGKAPARSGAVLSGPDAYCLVCDQTGVDHFERDRQRRLRQLDYWLSIGLIERKEYNVLRARYSRDVPHQSLH